MTVSSLYVRDKKWQEDEMAFCSVNTESKIVELQRDFWANICLCVSVIHHQVCTRMRATEVIVLL